MIGGTSSPVNCRPFVLLDDARPGGRSTLYTGLRELVAS